MFFNICMYLQKEEIDISQSRTQVFPQQMSIRLRAGDEHSFQYRVFEPLDTPVDLYILMDFSYSMSDDLENLKKMGDNLGKNWAITCYCGTSFQNCIHSNVTGSAVTLNVYSRVWS